MNNPNNDIMEVVQARLPKGKKCFNASEIAKILGRSKHWVRRVLQRGELLGHKIRHEDTGRVSYIIHREHLLSFLDTTAQATLEIDELIHY